MVSCPLLFPSVNTGIPLAVGTAFLRRQTAAFPPVNTGISSLWLVSCLRPLFLSNCLHQAGFVLHYIL